MALDTNVPAILQVVVDPSGAETGAARVSAAVGKMTDTSLKFLQTMQTSIDGTFKNLNKTNAFSNLAASSQSTFSKISDTVKSSFEKATSVVKTFWLNFSNYAKQSFDKTRQDQDSWFSGFKGKLIGITAVLTAVFSVEAISSFISKLYDVNNVYNAFLASVSITTGSIEGAKQEFQYLFNLSQSLGVEVESLTKSYTKFSAAVHGTALEGRGAKEIFEAISMASTVLHMHGHDTELMFYAITQSISKGRISREELVRQLAEKLPRAFGLAATAMYPMKSLTEGMIQLNKDLTAGTIPMNEFFLKFSKIIKTEYGPAAELASHMVQASVNRMKNSVLQFFIEVGQSKAMDAFSRLAEMVSRVLDSSSTAAASFGESIGGMVDNITIAVSLLSARDIDAVLRGVTEFINGLGLAFDVVARGLGGVKTEGSGFLNFMRVASNMVIIFAGAVTQLVNGLKLLGSYLNGPKRPELTSSLQLPKDWKQQQQKYLTAEAEHLKEREKIWSEFSNNQAATESALLKNKQNFDAAIAKNNQVSNTPFANSAGPTRLSIGIPTDEDLKKIYGSDPITPNAKALAAEESAAAKLQAAYESLMSRIKEKQELATAQVNDSEKLTAAEKTEVKMMHDLNDLGLSTTSNRYKDAEAAIHQTRVLEDMAVARVKELADLKAYDESVQFHLNTIGDLTQKTYDDIIAMEQSIAVHGKTEDQLYATADARLNDEAAAYRQAAAIQTLNGAAEKDIKFLNDMADATDTLRAARTQLNNKRLELESVKAAAETQKEWDKTFNSMEGRAKSMFMSIGSGGLNSWKDMLNSMKGLFRTTLLEYIYASFAKPFVIQIIGSIAGSIGATGLVNSAASAMSSGGLGSVSGIIGSVGKIGSALTSGLESTIGSIGGWFSNLGSMGTGPILDGLSSLGSSIQLGAGALANAMPYVGALAQLAMGNVKGAAFTAVGAALGSIIPGVGTALGAVIGSMVSSLFGGGYKRYDSAANSTYSNGVFNSTNVAQKRNLGVDSQMTDLTKAFSMSLGSLLTSFGLDDTVSSSANIGQKKKKYSGFNASFDGGSVSYWAGTGKKGDIKQLLQDMIDSVMGETLVQAIQKSKLSESVKALFDGMTDKTQVSNMISATINLSAASASLADTFGLTVEQAAQASLATGLVGDELIAFVNQLTSISGAGSVEKLLVAARSNLMGLLGGPLPETLKGFDDIIKGIDKSNADGINKVASLLSVRAGFEQYINAIDALKSGVSGSTFSMRTPQAQMDIAKNQLSKMFGGFNIAVPKSAAELVSLGDSIDYTTETGLKLAAAFPDLAKAFAATQSQVDALSGSMTVTAENFATLVDFNRFKGVSANYGNAFANDYAYNLGSGAITQNSNGSTTVSGSNQDVVAVLQALRADINATMTATAISSDQTARLLKLWNGDGMPPVSTRTA